MIDTKKYAVISSQQVVAVIGRRDLTYDALHNRLYEMAKRGVIRKIQSGSQVFWDPVELNKHWEDVSRAQGAKRSDLPAGATRVADSEKLDKIIRMLQAAGLEDPGIE